jgi:sporulation protein YlmC with PRC-barrel domain
MELVRDCLDKQLVDRTGHKMGRVDGLIMELTEGAQPRITFVEVGAVTQAARLNRRLGAWMATLARKWGRGEGDPYRIPWAQVVPTGNEVTVGVEAEKTPALAWERWLRAHVIGRIPGA